MRGLVNVFVLVCVLVYLCTCRRREVIPHDPLAGTNRDLDGAERCFRRRVDDGLHSKEIHHISEHQLRTDIPPTGQLPVDRMVRTT